MHGQNIIWLPSLKDPQKKLNSVFCGGVGKLSEYSYIVKMIFLLIDYSLMTGIYAHFSIVN